MDKDRFREKIRKEVNNYLHMVYPNRVLPEKQRTQLTKAFYAGMVQMAVSIREIIRSEMTEKEGMDAMDNLMKALEEELLARN